jgi:hypothetical protein
MARLRPEKLDVNFKAGIDLGTFDLPRRYTLTHSDSTGELYLTIGREFDKKQISGFYTRFMRDEVLAELKSEGDVFSLHVYCHVSGGHIFGRSNWRESIIRRELPLVLETIRNGDGKLFDINRELDASRILVQLRRSRNEQIEDWGTPNDYRI